MSADTGLGWPHDEQSAPTALGWPSGGGARSARELDEPGAPEPIEEPEPSVVDAESSESWPAAAGFRADLDAVSRETAALRLDPGVHERAAQNGPGAEGAPVAGSPPVSRETSPPTELARADAASRETSSGFTPWPRPDQPRIFGVANQKGGVGKTTSTVNLAAALAQHGARVLVVDLDPQGNASTAFGIDHRAGTASIYNVLVAGRELSEVAVEVEGIPGLYCAPATIDLAGAEIELASMVARESRLARALAASIPYDFVFVDCPPSLGLLTVNALVAAQEVLIPIQCEFYALEGLSQLLRTLDLVRSHLNPALHVSTILLTMYDGRTRLAEQVAQEVRSHFGDLVLRPTIPRSVRVSEAPGYGQTVMTYDPNSRGAIAYVEAAQEIAERSVVSQERSGQ